MAIKYLTDINLLGNQLQNAVIQVLATAPTSAKEGQIYYNSADKRLYSYNGSEWGAVGVVYKQDSTTGAVITGLDENGNVTTTNVVGLTLAGYTPVKDGYVTADMTLQSAFAALDEAVKNAIAGGGEVNQNAWSKITVKKQSDTTTAVDGAAADVTLSSDAKVDTFNVASGNKWVDINGSGKTVTIGHSLSGVTAGTTGAANTVPIVSVDGAGHVTGVSTATITPAAIGADEAGAADAVLGTSTDTSDKATVYGARALATEAKNAATAAQASADAKVASVSAADGIEIGGTATAPTAGIKIDPTTGNLATVSASGLLVTAPAADVYTITKDETSTDYAAVYHLAKNGTDVGEAINIPKDLFVQSGEIVDNPEGQPAGKYIKLVLQNQAEPIYINVADLVDAYTAGNGITISATNEVSANVVAANGLSVDAGGIKLGVASAQSAGAMSAADFTKLSGIADNATANTITLNGASTADPSFYAPADGGTAGQYLVSAGDSAPVWQDLPTILKKYTAQNTAISAVGGAFTWTITAATHGVAYPTNVQLFEVSTGAMIVADVTIDNSNVKVVINDTTGANTLAANTYRVVIIG